MLLRAVTLSVLVACSLELESLVHAAINCPGSKGGLNNAQRMAVLDSINDVRRKVAKGNPELLHPEAPTATKMNKLKYSCEYENKAMKFTANKNDSSEGWIRHTSQFRGNLDRELPRMFEDYAMKVGVAHIAHDMAKLVGCAVKKNKNATLTVQCNFDKGWNYRKNKQPFVKTGALCSECAPYGARSCDDGLCKV
ncbi:SCP domain-containing protein [Trichostrongylus colubriformis]|uniref:SCP domain-containing protein n=1 Tax=Trichostrongylus colubriformis TaxID=6319 RepID=A0AAN8FYR0_TRICO